MNGWYDNNTDILAIKILSMYSSDLDIWFSIKGAGLELSSTNEVKGATTAHLVIKCDLERKKRAQSKEYNQYILSRYDLQISNWREVGGES